MNWLSKYLYEPNLLVPGRKPVGPVKVDRSDVLAPDTACWLLRGKDWSVDLVGGNTLNIPSGSNPTFNSTYVTFTTSNDYLECDAPASFKKTANYENVTVMALVRRHSYVARGTIFEITDNIDGPRHGLSTHQHWGDPDGCFVYCANQFPATTATIFINNEWAWVTTTYLSSTNEIQVFKDTARVIYFLSYPEIATADSVFRISRKDNAEAMTEWRGDIAAVYVDNRVLSQRQIIERLKDPFRFLKSANDAPFMFSLTGVTAALTEDIANESDITAGGNEIVLTLTGDTWVTAGATFDAQRQNIIDGLDSAQAEAAGWDAVVKTNEVVTAVVRTSDTIVTITLSAHATYDITATETITVTIPASALVTSASPVVATPTFTIVPVTAAGGPPASSLSLMGVGI